MKKKALPILLMVVIISFAGCKKDNDKNSREPKISFTYNGQQYSTLDGWTPNTYLDITSFRFLYTGGISIIRPDLFGGTIIMLAPNNILTCAYLLPSNYETINAADCTNLRTMSGNPIDSVKVYWLQTGTFTHSFSDCRATATGNFQLCIMKANFSVTLVNKNNDKIVITNGTCSAEITN